MWMDPNRFHDAPGMLHLPPAKFHRDGDAPGLGWIFVFGANLGGRHGLGAAALAARRYGAITGQGSGPMGNSYAIPTKDAKLAVLPLVQIEASIAEFLRYANAAPQLRFWVTRIGCVLAGYSNAQIAPMFKGAPENCSFAREWAPFLVDGYRPKNNWSHPSDSPIV